ncbi:MAG: hypothetical protein QNJ46_35365, partial [Leptolyngbyaceae cyanobacterium MO_188.B28]|nr:hypothetical protein [Leptolyngbyaceae cyanobacterium MO_188.B28]
MQRYQRRLMVKTTVGKDEQGRAGLKTPVYEAETKQFRSTDEILRNTLLQQLFSPQELIGLLLVKVKSAQQSDEEAAARNQPAQQLKNQRFKDGVERWLIFSSGDNYYFADKPLAQQIRRLFKTEPDTAFRYGSLLTSECYDGSHRLENLKVKLVDFKDPQYAQFRTGDCHGKISPHRIKELGGRRGRPFQFRLGYRALWSQGSEQSPQLDFLAKGTLLADKQLTDDQGYDLILDRSSIKGVNKAQLDQLLPCGDYFLPKAAMGNRSNAQVRPYQNSWQFNLWYSEQAVLADCGHPTRQSLNELTGLMKRPLALLNHLVERSDQQQHRALDDESLLDESTHSSTEPRMISISRADKYGQLLYHPKVVDFIARQTRNEFVNAAVRTGLKHSSGMAMPAPDEHQGGLKRGQVCVPHLPEGEVILTRYPIVNSDNIRRYINVHHPTLSRTRGVVWIRPEDCKTYHQGDFDGDQLVVTPAAQLPHIAKETLRAGEPGRFKPVKQRPKLAYREVCNGNGQRRYQGPLQNAQIAFDSSRNSVGRIAAQIGRIQASQPIKAEEAGLFQRLKTKLLDRLFTALQVEVDYQKSAERFSDVPEIEGDRLLTDAKQWGKHHPCHFFDVYKDPNLYRLFPLPDDASSISVVAREIVNPRWRTMQLVAKDRSEYRYLFEVPSHKTHTLDQIKAWKAQYGDWADNLKRRFEQDRKDIKSRLGDQP